MKPNPHSVASSVRKVFIDLFERSDTSSGLGRSRYGGLWDTVANAVFKIDGNRAVTDEDPENYPQTTITMSKSDVDFYFTDIANGSAASLWVTDSGNWFAVGIDQHPVDCNCEVGTECNRWNGSNITGWTTVTNETGGRNAYEEATGEFCENVSTGYNAPYLERRCYPRTGCSKYIGSGQCVQWYNFSFCQTEVIEEGNENFTTRCNTNFTTRYNAPNFTTNRNIDGYNANLCNRWNEFTFNCETCYPQWIRVLQSAAGTVSTLSKTLATEVVQRIKSPNGTLDLYVQNSPIVNLVRAMIIRIRGNQIKVESYSDPGGLNKIDLEDGDIVYSPTGAEVTARYGIMVTPSEYNQQNFVGGVQVIREDV